jgi:uncharacterized protein YndB with AHSA1/START domain
MAAISDRAVVEVLMSVSGEVGGEEAQPMVAYLGMSCNRWLRIAGILARTRWGGGRRVVPDRISREVVIDAPPEKVWAIVTEPRHVARWFSDEAEIDLRPGGAMLLTWHGHGAYRGRVEAVEPPRRFAFRWLRREDNEPGEGTSTFVEFLLEREGDGTRLRVIESGFDRLNWAEEERARYAGENTYGWAHELEQLRDYAAGL